MSKKKACIVSKCKIFVDISVGNPMSVFDRGWWMEQPTQSTQNFSCSSLIIKLHRPHNFHPQWLQNCSNSNNAWIVKRLTISCLFIFSIVFLLLFLCVILTFSCLSGSFLSSCPVCLQHLAHQLDSSSQPPLLLLSFQACGPIIAWSGSLAMWNLTLCRRAC